MNEEPGRRTAAAGATSVARNAFWRFLEISGAEIISFGFMVLLARILAPADFGVIAMATGMILIAQSVVFHGFAEQAIQIETLDRRAFNTLLWSNLLVGFLLCSILAIGAFPLSALTGEPVLGPVLMTLSIVLPIMSIAGIYQARLRREMRFFGLTCRALLAVATAGSVGFVFAILGFGVWSLVAMQITHATMGCLVLLFFSGWQPGFSVSIDLLRRVAPSSFHLASSFLVDTTGRYLVPLLLGVFLPAGAVGLYFVANRLMNSLSMLTFMSVNELCLPVLARVRDDRLRFDEAVHTTIRITTLFCLPAFAGLALIADPAVPLLFGEGWHDAVPPLRILAALGIFPAWAAITAQILVAVGRPERALRLNLMIAAALVILELILAGFGLRAAVAGIALAYLSVLPAAWIDLRQEAKLDMRRLVLDQAPMMAAVLVMALAVVGVESMLMQGAPWLRLFAMLVTGAATYTLAFYLLAPNFARQILRQLATAILPSRPAVL
ncbi:MAG: lipopolysaccharide biosynthesis protein [Geminicoccaceae bacterium]